MEWREGRGKEELAGRGFSAKGECHGGNRLACKRGIRGRLDVMILRKRKRK